MKTSRALLVALAAVSTLALAPGEEPISVPPERAALAFERYKAMAGRWAGESSAGWKDEVRFETIARDSVVMKTSLFDAHPGETMVTMLHMHEGQLMLTHYCVAGNQPRLVATEINADASELTFTYRDGTGLASRDQGHMDKAVIHFGEDGSYRTRWTWFQDGAESWMEEIRLDRQP